MRLWSQELSRDNHMKDRAKSIMQNQLSRDDPYNRLCKIPHMPVPQNFSSLEFNFSYYPLIAITFFATSWWLCKLCINKIHKMAWNSVAIPDTLNDMQNWPCAPSLSTWFKKWNQTGLPTRQDFSAAEGDTKRRKSQLIPIHLFATNYHAKDP